MLGETCGEYTHNLICSPVHAARLLLYCASFVIFRDERLPTVIILSVVVLETLEVARH